MKKIILILLILTALYGLFWAFIIPDYIKANNNLINACTIDTASDKTIICD